MKNDKKKIEELSETLNCKDDNIQSDVNGSYTGMSADGSAPVQDADDL